MFPSPQYCDRHKLKMATQSAVGKGSLRLLLWISSSPRETEAKSSIAPLPPRAQKLADKGPKRLYSHDDESQKWKVAWNVHPESRWVKDVSIGANVGVTTPKSHIGLLFTSAEARVCQDWGQTPSPPDPEVSSLWKNRGRGDHLESSAFFCCEFIRA